MKILKKTFKQVKEINLLYKEIDILKIIEHPHIIKLITYFLNKDHHIVLILEYASGGTLKQFISDRKEIIEEDQARDLFKQLIEPVRYFHKKGIIHRDLKTDNIVFTENGTLKVYLKGV